MLIILYRSNLYADKSPYKWGSKIKLLDYIPIYIYFLFHNLYINMKIFIYSALKILCKPATRAITPNIPIMVAIK
jgi:hypothetical protein